MTAAPSEQPAATTPTTGTEAVSKAECVLEIIRAALRSDEFCCPGEHRSDGKPGDWHDLVPDLMDERGLPAEMTEDDLIVKDSALWRELQEQARSLWVGRNRCSKTLTVEMEYDGEYGEISYPVASGPCAEALGVDCDEDYSHAIWSVWSERRRLNKILREALAASATAAPPGGEPDGVGPEGSMSGD